MSSAMSAGGDAHPGSPDPVAEREGVGNPHTDVLVGADHLAGAGFDRFEPAREPAVQMLHRGSARGDHLEGGTEGVEIEVDPAALPGG